jgi:WD40 repeat protein/tRNA A-37 threonylcarbamoyl transferase component Bud32
MSQPTADDLDRPAKPDDQQTLLQWPAAQPADPLKTGIQAVSDAPRLEVGPVPLTRVAKYELLKEIGRGGMGVVFKARDVQLNRIVALKMIRSAALANSDELQRFAKEAAAAAQLQHPNIVALYDVSPSDQQPYLSMEYIGGTSLSERVSLGPLSGRRAAEYLELTARAVHYAHTRGILHRDLKPANVLLDENDQPKVTDFGLAKQMKSRSDQTRTGAVLGTPSYMSPEQAAGSKDIGPGSDVYSLGAILYELTTGKPPFCGETALATLNLVAESDPIPPRLLNPLIDRDLETICLKCLEKDPKRRYDSAESLADDLRRFISGEPITARRVSVVGRALKWCQRNKTMTAFSAGFLVLFSAFLAYSWYEAYKEKDLREQAERAQADAAISLKTMRHLLYLSEMRQAQQTLRRADHDGTLRILNEHWLPKDNRPDLRDWEWYFLKDRCQTRLAFGSHDDRAFAVAYRPDGKELASAGGRLSKPGEIKIWDLRTGSLLKTLTGHANRITSVAYHPDKNILASGSYDQTVKLWNLDTGEEIVTLRDHTSSVNDVAFAPKGDRLASAGHDLSVRIWDWAAYANDPVKSVQKLLGHDKSVSSVAFHPGGTVLASGSWDKSVKLWNLATGQADKTLKGHDGTVESLAFHPSGKTLVSGGGQPNQGGELLFWDIETGKIRQSRYGLSDRVLHVSASKDGKVAAAGADGILRIWNSNRSSEELVFRADPQAVNGVAFAPDGYSLASAGRTGRVSLWNSSAGSETLTLSAPGTMEAVAFSPTSRFLASAGSRGEVHLWNLDDPVQPPSFTGHKGAISGLAFSPDGHLLASGGEDRTVRIVDLRHPTREPVVLIGHTARIHAVAFRPKDQMIATAGEDETIRLHDPASGNLIQVLRGHATGILCLAFSPDGQWLASGGYDKSIRLWDLRDLKTIKSHELKGHTGSVNALAFNHDGSDLASASSDKSIRIWDASERSERFKLDGAPGPVHSLAWHPRGRRLVSIAQDRMIRLWDIVTRQEILEFEEHIGALRCVAFSADGRSLAAAGPGVVRVWQASKEMLQDEK